MDVTAARLDDCRAIAEIHVTSWQAAYAGLFPTEYLASLSVDEREESWQAILLNSASRTLVARCDGQSVGFVSYGHCRDQGAPPTRGEIWALYVAPNAWSTGAGWALWEAARVRMLHAGAAEVSLWVLSGNDRGRRFYDAAGFRLDAGATQTFERGGVTLAEDRLVFDRMSAAPSIERAAWRPLGRPKPAAHAEPWMPTTGHG
jgi:ribosomal protein S18 acetylase RimI-like enzyme